MKEILVRSGTDRRRSVMITVAVLALMLVTMTPALASAVPITMAYPDFSSIGGFQLNNDAYFYNNLIRLTDALGDQSGSVFAKQKVSLGPARSFSTFFTINMHSSDSWTPADGCCFVIQQSAASAFGEGGGLGYSDMPGGSIAIEFDTFDNYPNYNDENNSHIGVDLNGDVTSVVTADPPDSLYGNTWNVWVDYDGTTDLLEVRMSTGTARPSGASLTHTIDLSTVVGSDVYVGFTAATGGANEIHDVSAFYFNNAFVDGGITPAAEGPSGYEGGPASVEGTVTPPVVPAGSATRTSARFLDGDGQPKVGWPVTFSAPVGAFSSTSVLTDANGVASVLYTPPSKAGVYQVRAEADGGLFVDLEVGVTPGMLVHFRPYSARLTPIAKRILRAYAATVAANGATGVRIETHTARRTPGSLRSRTRLSRARAYAIRRYLLAELRRRHAYPKLYLAWYGGTRPLAGNDTRIGTALNRRAELLLLMPTAAVPTFPEIEPVPRPELN
ncbi:MAG: OmpA family protein [Coriobacteriia bacterium]|nr:OmpA family protein [Coriobacteriia bacterium]